jgi:lipopolysaccharide export system protein LptA
MKHSFFSWLFAAILLYVSSMQCVSAKSPQLFSKIVITSDGAICKKDPQVANMYVFEYLKNVTVTFADQSRVTADTLIIVFDSKDMQGDSTSSCRSGAPTKEPSTMDRFRNITFKGNVHVTSVQRQATADEARFDLKTQQCILDGHVKIWQQKVAPSDIPVVIESSKAELNLVTNQVQLLGSAEKPVQTTITLEGHPALAPKKKKHKHKSHDKNSYPTAK